MPWLRGKEHFDPCSSRQVVGWKVYKTLHFCTQPIMSWSRKKINQTVPTFTIAICSCFWAWEHEATCTECVSCKLYNLAVYKTFCATPTTKMFGCQQNFTAVRELLISNLIAPYYILGIGLRNSILFTSVPFLAGRCTWGGQRMSPTLTHLLKSSSYCRPHCVTHCICGLKQSL